jgi:hypothetical protein
VAAPQNDTKEWVFTSAKTDHQLIAIAATERFQLYYLEITAANSNSQDTSARVGFAASTLPAVSESGVSGVFFRHGGIPKGGGKTTHAGGAAVATGPLGVPPRFTCSNPLGGDLTLIMTYRILTNQDEAGG